MRIDDELFEKRLQRVMERFDTVERMLESLSKVRDVLDGDQLLENHDLCALLGVTKRTLQRYRQHDLIPITPAPTARATTKPRRCANFSSAR